MKNTIFDRIEEFAYKLSDKTVNKNDNMTLQERKEEKEIWDYFYFLILSQVFTFFFVILFGIIAGYLKTLIFVLIAFVFLRTKSGGYHCDSFEKCFFTTNVSFAIAGILSMSFYEYLSNWYIILVVLSNIYAIYIIPDCPLPWGNEESRGEKEDKKFQIQYKNRVTPDSTKVKFNPNYRTVDRNKVYPPIKEADTDENKVTNDSISGDDKSNQ